MRTHGVEFEFRRLALTRSQIRQLGLNDSLRPQKKSSKRWGFWVEKYGAQQMACELEAIHPVTLRNLVRDAIQSHIDPWAWEQLQKTEEAERDAIAQWAAAVAAD